MARLLTGYAYVDKELIEVSIAADHVVALINLDDDLEEFVECILSTGDKLLLKADFERLRRTVDQLQ